MLAQEKLLPAKPEEQAHTIATFVVGTAYIGMTISGMKFFSIISRFNSDSTNGAIFETKWFRTNQNHFIDFRLYPWKNKRKMWKQHSAGSRRYTKAI